MTLTLTDAFGAIWKSIPLGFSTLCVCIAIKCVFKMESLIIGILLKLRR